MESPIAQVVDSIALLGKGMGESAAPDRGSVVLVHRGALADSTEVFLIRGADGTPRSIALLSAAAAPGMVARAASKAREAAAVLGPDLGKAALQATAEGIVEGRSYAITPYCRPFGSPRVRWWLERARLRRLMLDWLAGVVRKTAAHASPQAIASDFERPLKRLIALPGISERLRSHGRSALHRLSTGAWQPRHALMHGDLWCGNLLLRRKAGEFADSGFAQRVAIIDWAGSKTLGYPIFDLIRIGSSLRVPLRQLRAEIYLHAAALQCTERDCIGYLLAATGCLLGEIEEFPIERFMSMTEASLDTLLAAINGDDPVARSRSDG